ncbi:MAG TPA: hypothetical protein VE891_02460 [Allosphingosinicella sp.]|nr:hypothetical protein [Allosphingosinicella sp.]
MSEQLDFSREDLEFIRADLATKPLLQPICHRFSAPDAYWNPAEQEARLSALVPELSRHGFEVDARGGVSGVEAWELVRPSEEWSARTVVKLCTIADEAGFAYDGWTWEPSGRPSYLRRVMSGTVIFAPLLAFVLVVNLGWSWFSGEVVGSPANVGIRILGAVTFIAIGSLLWSAYLEWEESRKYR